MKDEQTKGKKKRMEKNWKIKRQIWESKNGEGRKENNWWKRIRRKCLKGKGKKI